MAKKEKYLAIVLYEAYFERASYRPLYEESFVEILAGSLPEARKKLFELIKRREVSYKNTYGNQLSWKLRKIIDISQALESKMDDGIRELYSRHFYDIENYEKFEELSK